VEAMAWGYEYNKTQPNVCRTAHNQLNLVFLPIMLVLSIRDLYRWESDAYTQAFVFSYFIIDTLWIAAMGWKIVKDPVAILVHHVACCVLVGFSTFREEYMPFWSAGALIEINTVMLLTLRSGKLNKYQPLANLLQLAFLISWFPLRWGVPLYIIWAVVSFYFTPGHDPLPLIALCIAAGVLLVMQMKWSKKLISGQIKSIITHGL